MKLTKSKFVKSVRMQYKSNKKIYQTFKDMFWSDFGHHGNKIDFILQIVSLDNIKYTESGQDEINISQLKSSIKKNGFYAPIIVDDGYLINGHHRAQALKESGYSNIIAFVPKEFNSNGGQILNFDAWF